MEQARLIHSWAGSLFDSLQAFRSGDALPEENPMDILDFGTPVATVAFLVNRYLNHFVFAERSP